MIDWWTTLDFSKQVFFGLGILSLFLMVVELLLSVVGLTGADFDSPDIGAGDHPSGLGILSFRTITAFFTGFGWTGAILLNREYSLAAAIFWGFVAGVLLMFAVYWVMVSLMRLQSSGTLSLRNAIGLDAVVYMRIPGQRTGAGKVEVLVQGQLRIIDAFTTDDDEIPPRRSVTVVDTFANKALLVRETPLDQRIV
ncbi:MAG: hypothetical protein ACFCU4_06040 [Puniceicoccaceae bacterium]